METADLQRAFDTLKLTCARCGHQWIRRSAALPVRCPHCQSVKWKGSK